MKGTPSKLTYTITRNRHGARALRVTPVNGRGFVISTEINLPITHERGVCDATDRELREWVAYHGTKRERTIAPPLH